MDTGAVREAHTLSAAYVDDCFLDRTAETRYNSSP